MTSTQDPQEGSFRLSRRNFVLGGAAILGAGALSACNDSKATGADSAAEQEAPGAVTVAFDGVHQAGVQTPAQGFLTLIGFDLRAGSDLHAVQRLMRIWTEDSRMLTQGQNPPGSLEPEMTVHPSRLTVTVGFGPRLFDIIGKADKRPSWLAPMPVFSKDKLDEQWGQSDVVVQVCSDDPLLNAFVARHLTRSSTTIVTTKWFQQGFLNSPGVRDAGETPRNLFGQKDGTVNPHTDAEYDDRVWIDENDDSPEWMRGGSCLVVRRIHMNLDTWEELDRTSREVSMGRFLDSGAPLTGTNEFDTADFDKTDQYGLPVIDVNSHMALATPHTDNSEDRLLRRAYNYDAAPVPGSTELSNAGLVFCCFQKDPRKQFIPIQTRLDASDRLNTWITHIGSAVYAIVPGTQSSSDYWGAALLES
ncbi:Dyp-type peroxidase [Corynebacterium vitaeruminis]|uniref:Dyp-type peroxidase family protein n=1 Tax=Corynebacterium vitaeruminis DSM 20294 TaxID=1224164 RepID=W5Y8Y9_9CORY|nr:Dyp-type peroxidase [Corynebacterium vitaeruminis]AHI22948.1 Dyp-type peroxidase family protein [Corynebacterium vitaeruminis DSM 20294]